VPKKTTKQDGERNQLRLLAWVLALVVAIVSTLSPRGQARLGLELTAALIFAIGTVWPQSFRWLKRLFIFLGLFLRGRRARV
jgi:hypothetical protein